MNSQTIMAIIIIIIALIIGFIWFIKLPNNKKVANLKEWLKFAVVETEKLLGSGTGQFKLRYVYGLAIKQFPWIVSLIPFETFSLWVDEALEWMEQQLEQNEKIDSYINKEK